MNKSPGPSGGVCPLGAKSERSDGICRAKETKPGEKGGRESELAVVPRKRGNPPPGDPVEGRASRVKGTVGRKGAGDVEP